MTVEKACGYIREALEEMGYATKFSSDVGEWVTSSGETMFCQRHPAIILLLALDSLDPMGTTYKEEV